MIKGSREYGFDYKLHDRHAEGQISKDEIQKRIGSCSGWVLLTVGSQAVPVVDPSNFLVLRNQFGDPSNACRYFRNVLSEPSRPVQLAFYLDPMWFYDDGKHVASVQNTLFQFADLYDALISKPFVSVYFLSFPTTPMHKRYSGRLVEFNARMANRFKYHFVDTARFIPPRKVIARPKASPNLLSDEIGALVLLRAMEYLKEVRTRLVIVKPANDDEEYEESIKRPIVKELSQTDLRRAFDGESSFHTAGAKETLSSYDGIDRSISPTDSGISCDEPLVINTCDASNGISLPSYQAKNISCNNQSSRPVSILVPVIVGGKCVTTGSRRSSIRFEEDVDIISLKSNPKTVEKPTAEFSEEKCEDPKPKEGEGPEAVDNLDPKPKECKDPEPQECEEPEALNNVDPKPKECEDVEPKQCEESEVVVTVDPRTKECDDSEEVDVVYFEPDVYSELTDYDGTDDSEVTDDSEFDEGVDSEAEEYEPEPIHSTIRVTEAMMYERLQTMLKTLPEVSIGRAFSAVVMDGSTETGEGAAVYDTLVRLNKFFKYQSTAISNKETLGSMLVSTVIGALAQPKKVGEIFGSRLAAHGVGKRIKDVTIEYVATLFFASIRVMLALKLKEIENDRLVVHDYRSWQQNHFEGVSKVKDGAKSPFERVMLNAINPKNDAMGNFKNSLPEIDNQLLGSAFTMAFIFKSWKVAEACKLKEAILMMFSDVNDFFRSPGRVLPNLFKTDYFGKKVNKVLSSLIDKGKDCVGMMFRGKLACVGLDYFNEQSDVIHGDAFFYLVDNMMELQKCLLPKEPVEKQAMP